VVRLWSGRCCSIGYKRPGLIPFDFFNKGPSFPPMGAFPTQANGGRLSKKYRQLVARFATGSEGSGAGARFLFLLAYYVEWHMRRA
jgi:hypothetical protein